MRNGVSQRMWRYVGSRGLVVALALFSGILSLVAVNAADEPPSVIVVFDGSGSMWGKIEGTRQNKLTVAREACGAGWPRVGPQTRVGLASFGHRRGDCSDVEVMLPPEPLDVERIIAPLEKLNPRGRGPLTLALREAAKSLASAPGKSSLLLIHDDADNCQPEPVRGRDRAARRQGRRACGRAGAQGGGRRQDALPAADHGRALLQPADDRPGRCGNRECAAHREHRWRFRRPCAHAPPPRPAVSSPAPIVPQDAPAGLYLRALLAPKTEPVGWPLHWIVFPEGKPATVLVRCAGRQSAHSRERRAATWSRRAMGRRRRRQTVEVAEQGPDAGQSRPQRRHAAGERPGAEDRRAARRCHHQDQQRRAGCGRQEGCGRRPAGRLQGQRGHRNAAGRALRGARRAGPRARRAVRRRARRQPGPRRYSPQRRAAAADGHRAATAARSRRRSSASSRTIPTRREGGARSPARPPGKRSSCCRRAPTT